MDYTKLLKNTVETKVETQAQAEDLIVRRKEYAAANGFSISAAGYTYKTKKSKGEIVADGYLVKVVESYAGFWDDYEAELNHAKMND